MKAQMCRFKRMSGAKWETGVMIGIESDETFLIVTENGQPLTGKDAVYNFSLTPEQGCFETMSTAQIRRLEDTAYRGGLHDVHLKPGDGMMGG